MSCPKERSAFEKELELLQILSSGCDNPQEDEVVTAAMYGKLLTLFLICFIEVLQGRQQGSTGCTLHAVLAVYHHLLGCETCRVAMYCTED